MPETLGVELILTAPLGLIEKAFGYIDQRLKAAGEKVGGVGGAMLGGAGGAVGGIGKVLGGFGAGAATVVGSLTGVGDAIAGIVAKANPLGMIKFQRVLDDIMAVVGQRLAPILDLITDALRLVGDVLESVLPSAQEFSEILQPIRDAFKTLRQVFTDIAPIVKSVLTVVFQTFAKTIEIVAKVIEMALRKFQWVLSLLGISGGAALQTSVGKSVRDVQFQGAEEYAKGIYTRAYQAGGEGTGMSAAERTAEATEKTLAKLGEVAGDVSSIVKKGKQPAQLGYRAFLAFNPLQQLIDPFL